MFEDNGNRAFSWVCIQLFRIPGCGIHEFCSPVALAEACGPKDCTICRCNRQYGVSPGLPRFGSPAIFRRTHPSCPCS